MKTLNQQNPASAITGIGIVSALGAGWEEFLPALMEAEPAFSPAAPAEAGEDIPRWSGQAPDFDLDPLVRTPKMFLDPHSRLTLAATGMALQSAGIAPDAAAGAGIIFATAMGNLTTSATFLADAFTKGPRLVKPMLFPHCYANTSVSLAAMEWGLDGPHQCFTSGSTASGQALLTAMDLHRDGGRTMLLAGGADSLHPDIPGASPPGGSAPGGQGTDSLSLPLPFNPQSPGPLPGEAAVIMTLHPPGSGPRPLAWLLGGGMAAANERADLPLAVATAVAGALDEAASGAGDLDFACVSAQGMADLDAWLAQGLQAAVAKRSRPLPLVAPAGLCGDVLGATDALLAAAACAIFAARTIPGAPEGTNKTVLPDKLHLDRRARGLEQAEARALTLTVDPSGGVCALVLGAAGG